VELHLPGVQDAEHQTEGQEVEQRADRAEREHEPADERDVPVRWRLELLRIDAVGGDRQLGGVIQQVIHPSTCSTGAAATASAVSAPEIAPLDGVDVVDMPGPSL